MNVTFTFTLPGSLQIQGDSGEKVNILVGDIIGHCEKEVSMKSSCLNIQTILGLIFICLVRGRAKFTKEMWIHETNGSIAVWMLLPA